MKRICPTCLVRVLLVSWASVSCGQATPEAAWSTTFGGPGEEYGFSVRQTSEGGYIIAGSTDSYGAGGRDAWLIKTESSGDLSWNKTFGGSVTDRGSSVQQTTDGGYVIAGYTNSYGAGAFDVWLVKTDSSGDLSWNKTLGGSEYDYAYSIQQTSDGGYIIAGYTNSYRAGDGDVWLIRADSLGNVAWNQTFGGSEYDTAYSVRQTLDAGYIITGYTMSHGAGACDVWLIKATA